MTPPATAAPPQGQRAAAPAVLMPFVYAANEHREEAFDSGVIVPGAATRSLGPFDVPSYGFMRHLNLLVEASAGVLGTGTLGADWPFNLISEVLLEDVNGGQIYGPLTGFETYLVNAWGGYAFVADPREHPDFDATIAARFMLRIPVEIAHHNGIGSLANQASNAAYRVRITLANNSSPYSAAPTTPASVRVRGYLEAWSQPEQADPAGRPQATMPPNHGTTQFWSKTIRDVAAGAATIPITRVGNLIRQLLFVYRAPGGGARFTGLAALPDPIELWWDSRLQRKEATPLLRAQMSEGLAPRGRPAADASNYDGVWAYMFDNTALGHWGDGALGSLLPTVGSTRLELKCSFPAAGQLTILTNDVAPAEVNPAARYGDGGTGYDPAGAPAPPIAG